MSPLDMSAPRAVHRISYGPSAAQFGDLRLPSGPGPHPVVVALHGGFWLAKHDLEHLGPLCDAVAAAGFATWSLEYRRVGEAGGGFPGTFEDVAAGADALAALAQSYPLDLGRVVALGHSAGGHLALWLGARHRLPGGAVLHYAPAFPVAGVVALAPIGDLAQAFTLPWGNRVGALVGGGPVDVPERYAVASPAALLPLGVRQIVIHGADDEDVPLALSEAWAARARAAGDTIDLEVVAGAGHFEPIDPASSVWPTVQRALWTLIEPVGPRH